jgi:hypothetical protein
VGANLTRTIPPLPDEAPTVLANGIVIDVERIREFLARDADGSGGGQPLLTSAHPR